MPTPTFKITAVESQLYKWDKPPIWNGTHVSDKGRLPLVKKICYQIPNFLVTLIMEQACVIVYSSTYYCNIGTECILEGISYYGQNS